MSRLDFSFSLPPAIALYFEFEQLKQLRRQGWLQRGLPEGQCESVADHSFALALLAWLLCDSLELELDVNKVMRMALLHDVGEIDVGDLTPRDGVNPADKAQREGAAIARLFAALPNGDRYRQLWVEYEAGRSSEARFVRQLDKLEMALQAIAYQTRDRSLDVSEFLASAERRLHDPALQTILTQLKSAAASPQSL